MLYLIKDAGFKNKLLKLLASIFELVAHLRPAYLWIKDHNVACKVFKNHICMHTSRQVHTQTQFRAVGTGPAGPGLILKVNHITENQAYTKFFNQHNNS